MSKDYLVISLEEINGREALNTDAWNIDFVGITVDLDDGDVVESLVLHSEVIPNWCESLAVATPEKKEEKKGRKKSRRKELE